jgi:adenosylcobinamide-GDP ribazoletransferase
MENPSWKTWFSEQLNHYWVAQMFLTRLPVSRRLRWSEQALAHSVVYFPLVGLVVGLLCALTYYLTVALWTTELAAVFTVAAAILITGAFHEDGLADSADGIGGAFDIDRKLAIMRDSRIGTYGGVALILVVMAKVFAVIAIDESEIGIALITAHCIARWTPLPLIAFSRYLREEGTGKPFAASVSLMQLTKATLLALIVMLLLANGFGVVVLGAAALFTALAFLYLKKKLGGITGDTLGAVNSLTELLVYLLFGLSFTT